MRASGAASQFSERLVRRHRDRQGTESEAAGVIMAQVVPLPTKKGIPVVGEYQNALAAVGAKPDISFSGLEGFISAKVLVEGLKRSGKDLTHARFIRSMEGIGIWTWAIFRQLLADQSQRLEVRRIHRHQQERRFFQLTLWVNRNRRFSTQFEPFPVGYSAASLSEPLAGSIA